MTTPWDDGHAPSQEGEAPSVEGTTSLGQAADADDPYYAGRRLLLAEKSLEAYPDALRWPMHSIPRTWRQLVHTAARQVCANTQLSDAECVWDFECSYGPCTTANLAALANRWAAGQRGMHSTTGSKGQADDDGSADEDEDIEFVLLMLGVWPEHPQAELAREALIPYLASPWLGARIESAISLSHLRDERAIPALLALLTDGLPEPEPWDVQTEAEARERWEQFDTASFHAEMVLRQEVPAILGRWGIRRAVPALRHTLKLAARIERTEVRWESFPKWQQYWWRYQRALVGALARLGAFGALIGIEPPQEEDNGQIAEYAPLPQKASKSSRSRNGQLYQWRVEMCAEVATQRFEEAGRRGPVEGKEVLPLVEQLLGELFGMDEEERRAALEPYYDHQFRTELY